MARGKVMVSARDDSTRRALTAALAAAHEIVDAAGEADVIICPLSSAGLAAKETVRETTADVGEFIFTYDATEEGDVGAALRGGAFYCVPEPVDGKVLRAIVSRCLDLRALKNTAARQAEDIRRDLKCAARLQSAMLPPPEARLNAAGISVAVRCRPCAQVGGDLADYAEADGRAALLVADVVGHGVSAAMLTTVVKSAFVSAKSAGYDPAAVVANVLPGLQPFEAGRFVTLLAVRVDAKRQVVEYVNAGHPAGWLFQRGRVVERLDADAPVLMPGASPADYPVRMRKLPTHFGLLLFTDGVTDAEGDDGRFGQERVLDVLGRCPGGGATLLDRIIASVDAFATGHPQTDDLTLLTATVGLPGLAGQGAA